MRECITELDKYEGLKEAADRFKIELSDDETKMLFSIAYKLGYDKALKISKKSSIVLKT